MKTLNHSSPVCNGGYCLRTLLCLCLTCCFSASYGQIEILSSNSDRTLSSLSLDGCYEKESHLLINIFPDIAFTPNNELYGINGGLFKLDYVNGSYSYVGLVRAANNRLISSGAGLVGLDNDFLLMDSNDSLFKVSTATANAVAMGKMGYHSAGDLAILNDTLYMSDWNFHLIKIALDPSKSTILSVTDVGRMNSGSLIFSLFTAYASCTATERTLFAIAKNSIYKVNPQTAALTFVCSMAKPVVSYGATSGFGENIKLTESMPNVFTPNADGVNDVFSFTKCETISKTTIYNRWGIEVFNTEQQNHFWDGRTAGGEECSEGTYFYVILTQEKIYKGYVQLMR